MNNTKVVMLINAMFAGCSEDEKAKLSQLYKEAYTGTELYNQLKEILNECDFYSAEGRDLYVNGKTALEKGLTEPGNFIKNLSIMEHVIANAQKMSKQTSEYIESSRCDIQDMIVIDKHQADIVERFYSELINVTCYLVATLYDIELLNNIKIDLNAKAIDKLKLTTTQICALVKDLNDANKPIGWRIVKKNFAGQNIVNYNGYVVEYVDYQKESTMDELVKISPFLSISNSNSNELCCGLGNLTNLKVAEGASILNKSVITNLPLDCFDKMDIPINGSFNIIDLIDSVSVNQICVVTPESIVEILNRYCMLKTVKERNLSQKCIYCGGTNCNHFAIPESFSTTALPS